MTRDSFLSLDIRKKIENAANLPAIPDIASKILHLKNNEKASGADLAQLVQLDPALAAQLIRYATSPFYGYRGNVDSIQSAITVLGFDKSLNIALGLTIGQSLCVPTEGRLGLRNLWRHAVYSATLMQMIAEKSKNVTSSDLGLVYLSGLLHHIGYFILGHLFPYEHKALGLALDENDGHLPLFEVERKLLGATHCDLGAWLLRRWEMPPELITTTFEHHNQTYKGQFANFANLANLADAILGDMRDETFSYVEREDSSSSLGIDDGDLFIVIDKLELSREDLESLIIQIA